MRFARLLPLLALVAGWGCARPEAPVGGPVPETFLQIVATTPGNLSTVEQFDGPIQITFDRPLSERTLGGLPEDAVLLSPATGQVDVEIAGETLEVGLDGGFEAGRIYRLTILPRFQDRFQNRMFRPYDLFFSTGPALEPNLLAGLVTDRLTLDVVEDVRVDAVNAEGELAQSAVTDSTGVFSFPYLGAGAYTLVAYDDVAQNGSPDFLDPQDSLTVSVAAGDTLVVTDLAILEPDSTAAVLQSVTSVDSMTLRATFDDYLDPNVPLVNIVAVIVSEGGEVVPVGEYIHPWAWELRRAGAAAAAQAAAGAPATPGAPPAPPPGAPAAQTGPPAPSQDVILLLTIPTISGVTYEVEIQNVTNINGVTGGVGTAEFTRALPPVADPTLPAPVDPTQPAQPDPAVPTPGQPDPAAPTPVPGGPVPGPTPP